jgi:putative transposase
VNHKGWHSRGYLPHFDSAETVQFVTFRLADSLPRAVAEALAKLSDNLAETDHELDGG